MRLVIAHENFLKTCDNLCVLVYILIAFRMKKWFFSYRNNDISCTHYRGHATLREIFENMCNLMRLGEYFNQILYKNFFKGISLYRTMLLT